MSKLPLISNLPIIAAFGGLALLAGGGSAQAQCAGCGYETVYRPVVAPHCAPLVPHVVIEPVVTTQIVPVVTYAAVQRVHFVRRIYFAPAPLYDRFGYAYRYRVVPPRVNAVVYRDPSYGLIARE